MDCAALTMRLRNTCFAHHDRHRIGLLAGGATGRQQVQRPGGAVPSHTLGQHDLGERAELVIVAKEIRLADGQFPSQRADLDAIRPPFQITQIGLR
jgi:hypothetical protein